MESRLRQLEGKLLGSESAQPRGKAEPQKYDAGRQGASGALLTAPKAYNADADVVMEPAKPDKKVSNAPCCVPVLCCVALSAQAAGSGQSDMHADVQKQPSLHSSSISETQSDSFAAAMVPLISCGQAVGIWNDVFYDGMVCFCYPC